MVTVITFRADDELKKQAERIYHELGLNMTTALNMFLRATVREHALPIAVSLPETAHQRALRARGLTEEHFDELLSRIPVVDALPADWYDPADDAYVYDLRKQVEDYRAGKLRTYTEEELIAKYDLDL